MIRIRLLCRTQQSLNQRIARKLCRAEQFSSSRHLSWGVRCRPLGFVRISEVRVASNLSDGGIGEGSIDYWCLENEIGGPSELPDSQTRGDIHWLTELISP